MKKILLMLVLTIAGMGLMGQTENDRQAVREATDELVSVYGLNEAQQAEMVRIQERRFRNLAEIEPLREQDYRLYLAKRKAVRSGTENSIERMLREDQRVIFQQRKAERRKRDSDIIRQMRADGASKEAIQLKLLELEE